MNKDVLKDLLEHRDDYKTSLRTVVAYQMTCKVQDVTPTIEHYEHILKEMIQDINEVLEGEENEMDSKN